MKIYFCFLITNFSFICAWVLLANLISRFIDTLSSQLSFLSILFAICLGFLILILLISIAIVFFNYESGTIYMEFFNKVFFALISLLLVDSLTTIDFFHQKSTHYISLIFYDEYALKIWMPVILAYLNSLVLFRKVHGSRHSLNFPNHMILKDSDFDNYFNAGKLTEDLTYLNHLLEDKQLKEFLKKIEEFSGNNDINDELLIRFLVENHSSSRKV